MNQSSIRPKSWRLEPGTGDDAFNSLFLNAECIYLLDRNADGGTLVSLIQGGVEKRMTVSSGMNMAGESLLEALHSSEVTPSAPEKPLPLSHRTTRRYMSHADVGRFIDDFLSRDGLAEPETIVEATVVATRKGETLQRDTPVVTPLPDFTVTAPPRAAVPDRRNLRGWLEDSDAVDSGATDGDMPSGHGPAVSRRHRRRSGWVFALLVLVALGVGFAAVRYLPGLIPDTDPIASMESTDVSGVTPHDDGVPMHLLSDSALVTAEPDTAAVVGISDTSTVAVPDSAAAPQALVAEPVEGSLATDEAADLKYLNEHSTWRRSSLKSDRYKVLFDLFAAGNIKDIAEADYFAVDGVATNRDAIRVVDMLWDAYRTPTQRSNERELRKSVKGGEINLPRLYDTLSRYRDARPNKSPRPKR